jgi:pyroglutamyl-peptidase
MKILISSFGPFHNFENNPSELIMNELKHEFNFDLKKSIDWKVIPVTYKAVDALYNDNIINKYNYIIHLGVATNFDKLRIEINAHNSISGNDIDGFEPGNQIINNGNEIISSNFPFEVIDYILNKYKDEVVISDDAGRYLCNYIYYKSLYHFKNESKVIFIHIADFKNNNKALSIEIQKKIINDFVEYLIHKENQNLT